MNDTTRTEPSIGERLRDLLKTMTRIDHDGRFDRGVFDCDGMNPSITGEYVRYEEVEYDLQALADDADEVDAELLRLAGPPCDYPPCKGARAIEHTISDFAVCPLKHHEFQEIVGLTDGCGFLRELDILCLKDRRNAHHEPCALPVAKHPSSPAIELFLRERDK